MNPEPFTAGGGGGKQTPQGKQTPLLMRVLEPGAGERFRREVPPRLRAGAHQLIARHGDRGVGKDDR